MRIILRVDGTEVKLDRKYSFRELKKLTSIKYAELIRHVVDGKHIMLVDEDAISRGLNVNIAATRIYCAVCRPSYQSGYILGDVAIVPEGDIE